MTPMIEPKTIQAPERVAEHYDELDRWYLAIWGEHVHHGLWFTGRESTQEATLNLVTRLAERLSIGPGARVCDIGCGYGATARVLAREYGAAVTVPPEKSETGSPASRIVRATGTAWAAPDSGGRP